MKKEYQITQEGKADLEKELAELKGQRGAIAQRIATARDFGDLSENDEYSSARSEQSQVEGRIEEIEDILRNVVIIKYAKSSTIQVGSTVELMAEKAKKSVTYTVVGPVEADPLHGKISDQSPIGQAVLGKKQGDALEIETPKGVTIYTVVSVN
jgi:transcription elongation factor GreA